MMSVAALTSPSQIRFTIGIFETTNNPAWEARSRARKRRGFVAHSNYLPTPQPAHGACGLFWTAGEVAQAQPAVKQAVTLCDILSAPIHPIRTSMCERECT